MSQIDHKFRQPFVQKLLNLMELRNTHPAFDGKLQVLDSEDSVVNCKWEYGKDVFESSIDLVQKSIKVKYTKDGGIVENIY